MTLAITVLASGRGSNFKAVHKAIQTGRIKNAVIAALIVDRTQTRAEEYAIENQIPCYVVDYKGCSTRAAFNKTMLATIQKSTPDLILSLGFMRILSEEIIDCYPQKIINIHPSLLPSFPGMNAQKQAFEYGVKVSGCTVHYMDKGVDTGPIIDQRAVVIGQCNSVDEVKAIILEEEHRVIVDVVKNYCDMA